MRELLATFLNKWIDSTAALIEAGRAQGMAPTTIPTRDLATSLNLMNERAMFASFADAHNHHGAGRYAVWCLATHATQDLLISPYKTRAAGPVAGFPC